IQKEFAVAEIYCAECQRNVEEPHPDAYSSEHYRRIHRFGQSVPYSMPTVVMRNKPPLTDQQKRAREALLADRKAGPPPPKPTLSVSEAMRTLADQPLSPEDTVRLNAQRENDLVTRGAG